MFNLTYLPIIICNIYYLLNLFFYLDPRNYIINVMIYFLLHTISCVALIYGAFKVGTLIYYHT